MPGFDGTGPRGAGPMTGGGRGYCALPAETGWRPGAGRGRGMGGGRGWRHCYWAGAIPGWTRAGWPWPGYTAHYGAGISADQEKYILRSEAEALKAELEDVQRRIVALEKTEDQK